MIEGSVHRYPGPLPTGDIRVLVPVADRVGVFQDFEFVLDTGFDGNLTLPPSAVGSLELAPEDSGKAELADSEIREFELCRATISWNGQHREIAVIQSETQPPLLGMAMLWGSRLTIEAREGGMVSIEELSHV